MSLKKIIDWQIITSQRKHKGVIDGPFVKKYDLSNDPNAWVYACDVKIGTGTTLRGVPITANNREVFYAQLNKPVSLSRDNGQWSVDGLSKVDFGFTHITYVTFSEDIAMIAGEDWSGYMTRPLTYGELGSITFSGYGYLPYGMIGRFTKLGIFIQLVGG